MYLRAVETAVPATVLHQAAVRDLLASQPGRSRLAVRRLRAAFDASGIDTRHTVLSELDGLPSAGEPVHYDARSGSLLMPSTAVRNAAYTREAPPLFLAAAKQALGAVPGIALEDVSHVVTVSCTGFFAPGPDYLLVRQLGLQPTVQRFHIGFMGCHGAFPALRLADAVCRSDPGAVVLVVCAELCSLHSHASDDLDAILASSLFADGAAAAVLTGRPPDPGEDCVQLTGLAGTLTAEGEADMAWTIGDQGFDMVLSGYVPRIVAAELPAALVPLLGDRGPTGIDRWAVHPGGRAVLDKVQASLGLLPEQLAPSREVLRRYGNMSSATVLFVLQELLRQPSTAPEGREQICALAFGPGLTVETALLTRTSAP